MRAAQEGGGPVPDWLAGRGKAGVRPSRAALGPVAQPGRPEGEGRVTTSLSDRQGKRGANMDIRKAWESAGFSSGAERGQ